MANFKKKTQDFMKEFKAFALKGNVIDMAVGVMIATAFGKIVTSIVNDIFMPLLSLLTGRVDFTQLAITLNEGEDASKITYGNFLQTVVDFVFISICIFLFVKLINSFKKKEVEKPAEPPRLCPYCRLEIAKDATRCPHCTSQLDV
ncbi:MAG: large-conductance mechanosensitive channel protein MscL [Christensenellales bacterium]|jgi:large conductance mechanosensitive channel